MIKSISFDQNEIIQWILKLHCQTDIEVDCCYSKGNFYKKGITKPKYKFDLYPQTEDTVKANCEELPLENESINTLIYDPSSSVPQECRLKKKIAPIKSTNVLGYFLQRNPYLSII